MVEGAKLHCNDCLKDKPFDSHKDHQHQGHYVALAHFTECVGVACPRCHRHN